METEDSLLYLVFLTALAIQSCLLILFLLFWLFRRSPGGVGAPASGSRYQPRSRLTVLVAVGSVAVSVVAAFIYLISRSTSIDMEDVRSRLATEKAAVRSTPQTPQSPQPFSSSKAKSADPANREGGFDSEAPEAFRKFLRAAAPHPSELKITLSTPVPCTYLDLIKSWLKENAGDGAGASRHLDELYEKLVKEYGFKGPKEVLDRTLWESPERSSEPDGERLQVLDPGCGREAVVRWEQKTLLIGGQRTPVHLFLMRSLWSQAEFFRAFAAAGPEVFLEAHKQAFEFFGGCFAAIDYPDLPGDLRDTLKDKQSDLGKMFQEFSAHYHFRPNLESGKVLNRLSGTLTLPAYPEEATTLEQLNENFIALGEIKVRETEGALRLFDDERLCLLTLPGRPFHVPPPVSR
jgi:hypothetical protein